MCTQFVMREVIKSNLDRTRKNVFYILFKAASYSSACWHTSVNPAETEDKNYNISYKMRSCLIKKKTRKGRKNNRKMKKRRKNNRKKSAAQLPWDYWRHIQDFAIQRNFLNMECLPNKKQGKVHSFICVELRKSWLFGLLFFFSVK